jgi:hypothetical protein
MEDYLKDVPDSSPEYEDDHVDDYEPDAESVAEHQQEEGEEESGGRTIENVYRELSRKQEQFQERMMQQLSESQKMLAEALQGRTEQPEKQTGNTLDSMSVQELEAFRKTVAEQNPDALTEFDDYLNKRRVDDTVEQRIRQFENKSQVETRRRQANETAVQRYPELGQRNSDFYRAVNNRLQELGRDYVDANPRAVLDAANDVAAERGMVPSTTRRPTIRGSVGSRESGGGAPVQKQKQEKNLPKSAQSAEDREAIARRLAAALPKGKKFDDKAIEDKMAQYQENVGYFLRG